MTQTFVNLLNWGEDHQWRLCFHGFMVKGGLNYRGVVTSLDERRTPHWFQGACCGKVDDFAENNMLQVNNLARILFAWVKPKRKARS